jgi:hypothetical protein
VCRSWRPAGHPCQGARSSRWRGRRSAAPDADHDHDVDHGAGKHGGDRPVVRLIAAGAPRWEMKFSRVGHAGDAQGLLAAQRGGSVSDPGSYLPTRAAWNGDWWRASRDVTERESTGSSPCSRPCRPVPIKRPLRDHARDLRLLDPDFAPSSFMDDSNGTLDVHPYKMQGRREHTQQGR